jgi:hypothetical protein
VAEHHSPLFFSFNASRAAAISASFLLRPSTLAENHTAPGYPGDEDLLMFRAGL